MKSIALRTILAVAMLLPLSANAAMMSDKLAAACKDGNPGCIGYTMGGADRYWLVEGKHEACDAAADKKVLENVTEAVKNKPGFYSTPKPEAAVVPLLDYLSTNKLQSCALTMSFANLTSKCVSKEAADQTTCHAYIAGVMDVAMLMDRLHQQQVEKAKTPKSPFCENGKRKDTLSDAEVMAAISEFGQTPAAEKAANAPASAIVMDALLKKYSCNAKAKAPAAKSTPAKKK